jgi:hypothetical protein
VIQRRHSAWLEICKFLRPPSERFTRLTPKCNADKIIVREDNKQQRLRRRVFVGKVAGKTWTGELSRSTSHHGRMRRKKKKKRF